MKKTYLMPTCKTVNTQLRARILEGSPTSLLDTIGEDATKANEADNNLGHSIWNDETADGFNW